MLGPCYFSAAVGIVCQLLKMAQAFFVKAAFYIRPLGSQDGPGAFFGGHVCCLGQKEQKCFGKSLLHLLSQIDFDRACNPLFHADGHCCAFGQLHDICWQKVVLRPRFYEGVNFLCFSAEAVVTLPALEITAAIHGKFNVKPPHL